MTTSWTITRQVAFYAAVDGRGKWHAAWKIGHTPVCGTPVDLGHDAIHTENGQDSGRVHPIVCRRCLRVATAPGFTALGMEQ